MRFVLVLAALLSWTMASSVQAGSITALGNGRIAVDAQGVPLGQLLQELATFIPLDVVTTEPQLPLQPVTVVLKDVPLDQATARILLETRVSFGVGGLRGQPLHVILGATGAGLPTARPETSANARSEVTGAGAAATARSAPGAAVVVPRPTDIPAAFAARRQEMQAQRAAEARAQRAKAAADSQAEVPVQVVVTDDPDVPGGYSMIGENVTYTDANFVPYKNRPEVRARRLATDVTKIP